MQKSDRRPAKSASQSHPHPASILEFELNGAHESVFIVKGALFWGNRLCKKGIFLLGCIFDGRAKRRWNHCPAGPGDLSQQCEYYWPKSSVACTLSLSVRVQCSKGKGRFVPLQKFIVSSTVCLCFWLNRTSWSNGLSSIEKRPLHCGLVRFTWQGSPCCMFSYQIAVFADFYFKTGAFEASRDSVRWCLYRFVICWSMLHADHPWQVPLRPAHDLAMNVALLIQYLL